MPTPGSHSRHVVDLVLGVCDRLGLDAAARRDSEFVALLHDVGKIRIPARDHPEARPARRRGARPDRDPHDRGPGAAGARRRPARPHRPGRPLVPRALGRRAATRTASSGDEIPLIARIVCACDAFSAMTTDRSYRKARSSRRGARRARALRGNPVRPAASSRRSFRSLDLRAAPNCEIPNRRAASPDEPKTTDDGTSRTGLAARRKRHPPRRGVLEDTLFRRLEEMRKKPPGELFELLERTLDVLRATKEALLEQRREIRSLATAVDTLRSRVDQLVQHRPEPRAA